MIQSELYSSFASAHIWQFSQIANFQYYGKKRYLTSLDARMNTRIAGIVLLLIIGWNVVWVVSVFNYRAPFISVLFLFAFGLTTVYNIISVIINWNFAQPKMYLVNKGHEPRVAILIPTYGEPVQMVLNTLHSIVSQDWPHEKLTIAVGDDGKNTALREAVLQFAKHTSVDVVYHNPHPKGGHWRLGEAKAGNLNSLLWAVLKKYPSIQYVETRDADDLVGNSLFLRYCLGQLLQDRSVSFVQTIKECQTSSGDPFSNLESIFYRRVMLTRTSANAVFPCGSGLVWRLKDLKRIGGFPYWNLVEDLQSGYEILLIGGRGAYIPIVGAIGQIAPEDIPNLYKQRGTWALDTLRLFFWKNPLFTNNLTIMQKLHFFELEYSYLLSFAMLAYVVIIAVSLFLQVYPFITTPVDYAIHTVAFAISLELFSLARIRGISYKALWRSRQIWIGLCPVFIIAAFRALYFGAERKPIYRVTRKAHKYSWYWQETLFQYTVIFVLLGGIAYNLGATKITNLIGIGSIFWALFFVYGFSRVARNSYFGIFGHGARKTV